MKNRLVILGIGVTALGVSSFFFFRYSGTNLNDEALLSIIKNDQKGFEKFIAAGGKLGTNLEVEGAVYTVGELTVKYNRLSFVEYALSKKMKFEIDHLKDFDVNSLSVSQNNPEMLSLLLADHKFDNQVKSYGDKGWTLLHMASAQCSYKVVSILHEAGMSWDLKSKDGTTALTIAAEEGCIQALSYFKEQGADFRATDARGMSALAILRLKKSAALKAFADSFIEKKVASAEAPLNFYNKRVIPKDQLANREHLVEPEDRPEDANETAEYSEFSD